MQESMNNRSEVERSQLVGCYFCESSYPASRIDEWCDGGETAVCAECGVDSVIAESQDISDENLQRLNNLYFH